MIYMAAGIIEPPKFNESMTYCQYQRLVDKHKLKVNEQKYNLILNIINDWLDLKDSKFTQLTSFKNMDEENLLQHNGNDILIKYQEKIKIILELDIKLNSKNKKYILFVLMKALNKIDYRLTSKHDDEDNILYTIYKK